MFSEQQIVVQLCDKQFFREGVAFKRHFAQQILQQDLYKTYMNIALKYPNSVGFRAAWALETAFFEQPHRFAPYYDLLIKQLSDIYYESVRRHYTKILTISITKGYYSPSYAEQLIIIETVAAWCLLPEAKVGSKVWCLSILSYYSSCNALARILLDDLLLILNKQVSPAMCCITRKINRSKCI